MGPFPTHNTAQTPIETVALSSGCGSAVANRNDTDAMFLRENAVRSFDFTSYYDSSIGIDPTPEGKRIIILLLYYIILFYFIFIILYLYFLVLSY